MKLYFLLIFLFLNKSYGNSIENSWIFSGTTHFWLKGETTTLNNSPLTANDSPLALPKYSKGFLIQEDFSAKNASLEWIFRPSIGSYQEAYNLYPENTDLLKKKIDGRINELYFINTKNSIWTYALGLQNFQWGPAELMSPSNPLFHFSAHTQDPSFQIQGHSLFRLNHTPDENWNFILLYEFAANEEESFIYKTPFVPKGLLKIEYRFPSSTDYIGISTGNEQMHDPFIGEYGNFNLDDEFSFYFDLKQSHISKRYYPYIDYGQPPRMNLFEYDGSVYLLSLLGLRFETDYFDFRWEEISNELGYSKSEMEQVSLSFQSGSPLSNDNMKAFLHNGRELVSKSYSYLSLRSKNLISWLDSTISIRGLYAHRDQSSLATLQWDGSVGDRVRFFMNIQTNFGKSNSEMTFLYKNKANIGIDLIW